jgi:hypothetical protein
VKKSVEAFTRNTRDYNCKNDGHTDAIAFAPRPLTFFSDNDHTNAHITPTDAPTHLVVSIQHHTHALSFPLSLTLTAEHKTPRRQNADARETYVSGLSALTVKINVKPRNTVKDTAPRGELKKSGEGSGEGEK